MSRDRPHFADGSKITARSFATRDEPFYHQAIGGYPTPDQITVVRADASYKVHQLGKTAAVSWQVGGHKLKTKTMRRFAGGSQMAETEGVIRALEEAHEKGARHVLVQTDCQTAVRFLAGVWNAAQDYTEDAKKRLEEVCGRFESVQVQQVQTNTHLKDVDKTSKRARRELEQGLDRKMAAFVGYIDNVMRTKKPKRWTKNGVKYYAAFPATHDPPFCSCDWWRLRVHPGLLKNHNNVKWVCQHVAAAFADAGFTAEQAARAIHEHYKQLRFGQPGPN